MVPETVPEKVKVLHIITGLNVGGAENMLAKLIEQDGDASANAEVLSLLPPGPVAERIEKKSVAVHTLGMRRGLPSPVAIMRLARLVSERRPDLIHGWMYHGNLAASFARLACRQQVPLIWNIRHSIPDLSKESRQTRVLLRLSARLSRGPEEIVYNSQVSRSQHEAIGYNAGSALVIPNGFDLDRFAPNPEARGRAASLFGFREGAFRIACIARLHPMKDQASLVRAVAMVRAKGCDARLLLVGHGLEDPPPELAAVITENGPQTHVTTCGARFDVAEWLPGMDMLAVPSAWGEAFPNVIGEALACGIPVVATDVGDSALIVKDDGIIVPPGDTKALAEAIAELARLTPEERQAMGRSGRQRVKRDYAIPRIAETYAELYASCADKVARQALAGSPGLTAHQNNAR